MLPRVGSLYTLSYTRMNRYEPVAPPAAAPSHAPPDGLHIRHLHTRDDFVACVALQHETWGADFSERVPAAILKVSQRLGGVSAGAFDAGERLVGFVFGITGVEHGRLVHWSDMLAVRPELRDHGIGRRLKQFQREALLQLGVGTVYWTFDPLVARNAHFNLNRLGVRVTEYVIDMYGSDTDSALHRGLGTDRFIVAWDIGAQDTPDRREATSTARVLNASDGDGIPTTPRFRAAPARAPLRVEIPLEIHTVQDASLDLAGRWRTTTRAAFTWALEQGYHVAGFYRDAQAARGYYILSRKT